MAAGTWAFVNSTRTKILDGTLASGGSFKIALYTSSASVSASSTLYSGLSGEVGTTNTGYTTGGIAITPVLSGTTSVTFKGNNPQWTAGSAGLSAQVAVLYQSTNSQILAYVLLDSGGATVTATSGNTLTIDITTNPVFTLA